VPTDRRLTAATLRSLRRYYASRPLDCTPAIDAYLSSLEAVVAAVPLVADVVAELDRMEPQHHDR
jgi:hypothetical protein